MRSLDELLRELKVDDAGKATVGPLPSGGVGGSLQAARDQAAARAGMWAARAGGVSLAISEAEARTLIDAGAVRAPGTMT